MVSVGSRTSARVIASRGTSGQPRGRARS
jgi:hypothetical protein